MIDYNNSSFVMLLGHFLENEHLKSLIIPQSTALHCENLIESFALSTSFDESLAILDSLKPYLLSGEKDLSDFYFSLTNALFLREIRFNVSQTVKTCDFLKDEFMAQYTYYAVDSASKRVLGSGLKKISDLIESISDTSSAMPVSFQIAHLEAISEDPNVMNNYVVRMLVKDLRLKANQLLNLKVKFAATIQSIKNS